MTTEDKTLEGEVETLNSNESASDEGKETPKTYTQEELDAIKRKMQSDSEKGVQDVIKQKKLYESALKESAKLAENPAHLIDLYDEKPEIAIEILNTFYEGINIDTFKESIGYQEDLTNPKVLEKKATKLAQEMEAKKTIEKSKSDFIAKLKMEGEEKEAFETAFQERMELKSFKVDDLEKHLEKAYMEIADDESIKELKKKETIARSTALGDGKSSNQSEPSKTTSQKNSDYNKNFLRDRGIL